MEKNYKKYKNLDKRQYTTFIKSGIYIKLLLFVQTSPR